MTRGQHATLMSWFDRACELPDEDARRLVHSLDQQDPELATALRAMLEADRARPPDFLVGPGDELLH